MNHANRPILFGADGHPTLELLRQYQEGLLSPALNHQLERHLLDCELCADIVEGMALSDATQTKAAVADISQRLTIAKEKRRAAAWYSDWRAVAAVFVLLCSAVMVIYYQYTNLQTTPETIAVEQPETIESHKTEPSINYAPPIAKLEEEIVEEVQPAPPIIKPKLNTAKPIVAEEAIAFAEADEAVFPEATITEIAKADVAKPAALEEVTFDFKPDSAATIAKTTAQPKARAMALSENKVQIRGVAPITDFQRNGVSTTLVQGTVTDDAGNPLPGVLVQVKGTTHGVSTNQNGIFSLQVPKGKNTLTFRYIGYETKEQKVDTTTNLLAINLQPDNKALSEVVVTGMGKQPASTIEKPKPTIGTRAYKLYLKNEQRPLTSNVKGKVIVGFIVTEKGQLENVRVLKSLNPEADAEAIRLIQQGPAWEPAKQNGNIVTQQVKVVVRFR